MTAPLTLHLHGAFRARDAAGRDVAGLSRRAQAMLAFLALQPDMRAERALVADLLWSDRPDAQARASLRQELSVMRRVLPDGVLDANRQAIWLDPSRIALAPGSGDILAGFDLPSEGFEDWLRLTRMSAPDTVPTPGPVPSPVPAPTPARDRPALAVMPFLELGSDPGDMFADGIVEEITGALSRVHDFHVVARQSAFALRGMTLDAPAAAARLGVDYLVEGRLQRAGERVRLSVQLVSGEDGRTLWSARFDDRLDDLFDLQDRIAAQVAGHLSPSLRSAEIARARTRPPESRTAYELVLSAMPHFWSHTREGNAHALTLLDLALASKADYGPALAYKAWVLAQQPSYIWSDDPAADRVAAMEHVRLAARLTGDHAPSLVALGAAVSLVSKDLELADSFIDRALAIDPNNAWGWLRRGWTRNYSGRTDEARAAFDRAESLSPLDPFLFNIEFGRGGSYLTERRFDEALVHFRRGMTMSPEVQWAWRIIAVLKIHLGRTDEAVEALQHMRAAYPGLTIRRLAESIPPTIIENQPQYYDALRAAGLPDE